VGTARIETAVAHLVIRYVQAAHDQHSSHQRLIDSPQNPSDQGGAVSGQQPPTDAELNTFILTRLALAGVDLDQLAQQPEEKTGAPSREQALESLRTFVAGPLQNGARPGGTPAAIAAWSPPAQGEWAAALAQQASPPLEYPSITTAWTGDVT
jgi:hypothetical protein